MTATDTAAAWRKFRLAAPVRGGGRLARGALTLLAVFEGADDPDTPEARRRVANGLTPAALVPSVLAGPVRSRQPDLMQSLRVRLATPAVTVRGHLELDEEGYRWLPRGEPERDLAREFAGFWSEVSTVSIEPLLGDQALTIECTDGSRVGFVVPAEWTPAELPSTVELVRGE